LYPIFGTADDWKNMRDISPKMFAVLERRIYYLRIRIYSFEKYYKILSKKDLIMSKSNICFDLIFSIKEIILRFADVWTYEIFEISNIYSIQVTFSM